MYVVGNLAKKYVREGDLRPACVANLRKDSPEYVILGLKGGLHRVTFLMSFVILPL
jgi:hypothetical protein